MRVGILTFHHVTNLGAVLQAYALCRYIRELGCESQVIDYRPEQVVGPYQRWGRRPSTIWNHLRRSRKCRQFRQAFIPTTKNIYFRAEEIASSPPALDVYVCGSDQIWNLNILGGRLDGGFFLTAVPEEKRRIAYAPSFGDMAEFPLELREEAARSFLRLHAISVREQAGQAVVEELLGRKVPIVLDPSLLVDDYSEAIVKPRCAFEQCIVVYYLDDSEDFRRLVRLVRERLQLPIVNISPKCLRGADFNYLSLGPSEWLGWMEKASFVCTNSFHGLAYSMIFRKNFVSFPHRRRPGMNVRARQLLTAVGLQDRFVMDRVSSGSETPWLHPIDYGAAETRLKAAVTQSKRFLEESLFQQS